MLSPQNRTHLMDSLRPPTGYTLDYCIGTTYSLDLMSLLTVPLSFTFFDFEDRDGKPCAEPIALLEAMRQYASKITLFCQAGKTYVPASYQQLNCFLEESVWTVMPEGSEGVFHPKIWILRFVADKQPVTYRVLCLSRNLTFDRSWDTMLSLDGDVVDRSKGFSSNRPLSDFIKSLPGLSVQKMPIETLRKIKAIGEEIRYVKFVVPDGFDEGVTFQPLGIPGHTRFGFDGPYDRLLLISPFVDDSRLATLHNLVDKMYVISRTESLDQCSRQTLKGMKKLFVLDPSAEPEDVDEADEASEELRGLHAKVYVFEKGAKTLIFTGSANGTDAAFKRNVEFLVGLRCKTRIIGIDSVLSSPKGQTSFRDLLRDYDILEAPPEIDDQQRELDRAAENYWRVVLGTTPSISIEQSAVGESYSMMLQSESSLGQHHAGVKLRVRPLSLTEMHSIEVARSTKMNAQFEGVSFEALTSFFAFESTIKKNGKTARRQFVLNLPTTGMPEGRRARVLQSLLKDKEQVLRLLMMILDSGDPTGSGERGMSIKHLFDKSGPQSFFGQRTLFESLMRVLAQDPARIDQLGRVIEDLVSSPNGASLLPEGFDSIWPAIVSARRMEH